MLPPGKARLGGKRVGDWTATQAETRYGCFLPDLTGLARDLPAASLPVPLYQVAPPPVQGGSTAPLAGPGPALTLAGAPHRSRSDPARRLAPGGAAVPLF